MLRPPIPPAAPPVLAVARRSAAADWLPGPLKEPTPATPDHGPLPPSAWMAGRKRGGPLRLFFSTRELRDLPDRKVRRRSVTPHSAPSGLPRAA